MLNPEISHLMKIVIFQKCNDIKFCELAFY